MMSDKGGGLVGSVHKHSQTRGSGGMLPRKILKFTTTDTVSVGFCWFLLASVLSCMCAIMLITPTCIDHVNLDINEQTVQTK